MRIDRNRNLFFALVIGSLAALVLCAAVKAQAATEIVPSVGMTRSVDTDETKSDVGLALRGTFVPSVLDLELKGQYRKQDRFNGALTEKMWPVTASLWATPLRVLYAGGGVGWYHTTLEHNSPSTLPDETHQKFGCKTRRRSPSPRSSIPTSGTCPWGWRSVSREGTTREGTTGNLNT